MASSHMGDELERELAQSDGGVGNSTDENSGKTSGRGSRNPRRGKPGRGRSNKNSGGRGGDESSFLQTSRTGCTQITRA